jgi:hypothetical protein
MAERSPFISTRADRQGSKQLKGLNSKSVCLPKVSEPKELETGVRGKPSYFVLSQGRT